MPIANVILTMGQYTRNIDIGQISSATVYLSGWLTTDLCAMVLSTLLYTCET